MASPGKDRHELARRIDQALLDPGITSDEILAACEEAKRLSFRALCVNPAWVGVVSSALAGSETAACAVIGFPLGANILEVKLLEARRALEAGAAELDAVIDLGALRSGNLDRNRREVESLAGICHPRKAILKVIIEAPILADKEKIAACRIARECGADFVKTSTGFGAAKATMKDVRLISKRVSPELGVKAAGGIRTLESALRMIKAGATRIGTSTGAAILGELGEGTDLPAAGS